MVRVLIAYSGGGKTCKIKNEIINRYFGEDVKTREVYVIEREEYSEYSNAFNEKYVHVLKPSSDISFLEEIRDSDIFVDCECMADGFLNTIANIVKSARIHNNNVTITFLDVENNEIQHSILANASEVLVGQFGREREQFLEAIFAQKIRPQTSRYDFRKLEREE